MNNLGAKAGTEGCQHEKRGLGSCAALSRSFLKVLVCMAPDLKSATKLSTKLLQSPKQTSLNFVFFVGSH